MTIRVGESWQARNGHRRWVSMPPCRPAARLGVRGLAPLRPPAGSSDAAARTGR